MDLNSLIVFLISWGPTILFALIILFSILLGTLRGFHKSLIYLVKAFIIDATFIILYLIIINIPNSKDITFILINKILSIFNTSLNTIFEVNEEITSFTPFIAEILPKLLGETNTFIAIVTNDLIYLDAIINIIYNLFIALIMFILALITTLIAQLCYMLFVGERKYKKQIRDAFSVGEGTVYKKKRTLGALIGAFRGVMQGLIVLIYIGALFFITSGTGTTEKQDMKFDDENITLMYNSYQALSEYGNQGIYKYLNNFKDKNNVPYYLFAVDLIFNGNVKDDDLEYNFYLKNELNTYLTFSQDLLSLILKYDDQKQIEELINNNFNEDIFEALNYIFLKDEFIIELQSLIDEFEATTFITNLSLSIINSILMNIKNMNMNISQESAHIIDIVFLSENALRINDIVSRTDINTILYLLLDILRTPDTNDELEIVNYHLDNTLKTARKLTFLANPNKTSHLNKMFSEVYYYILSSMLEIEEEPSPVYVKAVDTIEIDWFKEVNALLDLSPEIYNFYEEFDNSNEKLDTFILDFIKDNSDSTDKLIYFISKSKIIGAALSSDFLTSSLSKEIIIPSSLNFNNIYDENGNFIKYGEIYNLLNLLKFIASNEDAREFYDNLINGGFSNLQNDELIDFVNSLNQKVDGYSLLERLASSEVLNFTLTYNLLENIELNSFEIYLPKDSYSEIIEDDISYKRLNDKDLLSLFNSLPILLNVLEDYLDKTSLSTEDIIDIVSNDSLSTIINKSRIIEGTITKNLVNILDENENIIITDNMKTDIDVLLANGREKGELKQIIYVIRNTNLDLESLLNNNFSLDLISNLTEFEINEILKSKIINYSISYNLNKSNEMNLVIPSSAKEDLGDLVNGEHIEVIKPSILADTIKLAANTFIDNNINLYYINNNLEQFLNNDILHASIIYYLVNNNLPIAFSTKYIEQATKEKLENFDENIFKTTDELMGIITFLNSIFKIDEHFNLNDINFNEIVSTVYNDTSKINNAYLSNTISYNISINLDNIFNDLINLDYLNNIKVDEIYEEKEIINLIIQLKETFGINDINLIDEELLAESIFNLKDKFYLDNLYDENRQSRIILYLISTILDETIIEADLENDISLYVKNEANIYHKNELAAIINTLYYVLNIKNINDFNININYIYRNINSYFDTSYYGNINSIDLIYNSIFLATKISEELFKLDSNFLSFNHDNIKVTLENTNILVVNKDELINLRQALEEFNIINLNNIILSNITLNKINNSYKNSLILANSFTSLIINSKMLIVTKDLINNEIIIKQEINNLVNSLSYFNINTLNDLVNYRLSFSINNFSYLTSSALLTNTVSDLLTSNDKIVINSEAGSFKETIDNNDVFIINTYELNNLLYSLATTFKTDDILNFHMKMLSSDDIDNVLASNILIDTLVKEIINVNPTNLYIDSNLITIETDYLGNKYYQITKDELKAFITSLNMLGIDSYKLSINISLLLNNKDKIENILNSNIILHAISEIPLNVTSINIEVYNLVDNTYKVTSHKTFDKNELISYIQKL